MQQVRTYIYTKNRIQWYILDIVGLATLIMLRTFPNVNRKLMTGKEIHKKGRQNEINIAANLVLPYM